MKSRDFSGLGWIDYGLMGGATALAVWSAGMSIGQISVATFSSAFVVLGTVVSYLMRTWVRRLAYVDVALYILCAFSAWIFWQPLQDIMPEGGYPRDVLTAGGLAWMLTLGSFFTWRDSTLLFHAVPAIALFGLVGVYDTYGLAVFMFFGYLVCLTTFFARAHSRQMLREAIDSGYFSLDLAPGAPRPTPESTPGLMERLYSRPWRWVAGPGWALASALVVVFVSLLGAPVIQQSMKGVAGFVRVASPRTRQALADLTQVRDDRFVGVATGPVSLPPTPAFAVTMDHAEYLRRAAYDSYTGRGWSRIKAPDQAKPNHSDAIAAALDTVSPQNRRRFSWSVEPLEPQTDIPLPGLPIQYQPSGPGTFVRDDGTIHFGDLSAKSYRGVSVVGVDDAGLSDALQDYPSDLGTLLNTDQIAPDVAVLARLACQHATTDREKADAIESEIDRRIEYSVDASAAPENTDPCSYVLFVSHVAYCDMFASTMVAMARSVGIPARYVTGYRVGEDQKDDQGRYIVKDSDSHAWAELLFKDVGWVVFDATENARAIPGEGVGTGADTRPWYRRPIFLMIVDWSIGLTLVAGLLLAALGYRHRMTHPNYSEDLDRLYLSYAKALTRATGVRRPVGSTSTEFVESVVPALGPAATLARSISAEFESCFYSVETPTAATITEMKQRIAELTTALKSQRRRGV